VRICRTRGTKRFFAGRNEYGGWFGWNIIPGHFGLMVEVK